MQKVSEVCGAFCVARFYDWIAFIAALLILLLFLSVHALLFYCVFLLVTSLSVTGQRYGVFVCVCV
jgi:hypothetical protein